MTIVKQFYLQFKKLSHLIIFLGDTINVASRMESTGECK